MARLAHTRASQNLLVAEFVFTWEDTVLDSVADYVKGFRYPYVASDPIVFDCINMPPRALICGGEVLVEEAYTAPATTVTLSVGIAGAPTAFANAVDLMTQARTELLLTTTAPYLLQDGANIRITQDNDTGQTTAGKVRVRVMFTLDGRIANNM